MEEDDDDDDDDDDSGSGYEDAVDDDNMNRILEFKYLVHLTSDHRNVEVELEGDHWPRLGFKNA